MRKDRWFRGALLKQRRNTLITAAIAAAFLVGVTFVLIPQSAEAGGGSCMEEFDALVEATIEVRLVCRGAVWTDDCRVVMDNWFDAMDAYIECVPEPI